MILITGHSHKLEGIAFVADTNDLKEALDQIRDAWNASWEDQVKIVVRDGETGPCYYLLSEEVTDEQIDEFEDETPRREGHILYPNQFDKPGIILGGAPW